MRRSLFWLLPGLLGCALLSATLPAGAQAVLKNTLCNCDVQSPPEEECDEFEIEIYGCSPSEIGGTYRNSNYGNPQIVSRNITTFVRYVKPAHKTKPNTIEHFGVSFIGGLPQGATVRARWKSNHQQIGADLTTLVPTFRNVGTANAPVIETEIENPEAVLFWVQRRVLIVPRSVSLDELMTNLPLYLKGSEVDEAPEPVEPGEPLFEDEPIEMEDDNVAEVMAYSIFEDAGGEPGRLITTTINAVNLTRTSSVLSGDVVLENYLSTAPNQTLTLTFRPQDGSAGFEKKVEVLPDGHFTLADLPRKKYTVHVKGSHWLASNVALDLSQGSTPSFQVTLRNGDANNDNFCNIFDLGALADAFYTLPGDTDWNPQADFNGDSSVDIFDLAILAESFNVDGDL